MYTDREISLELLGNTGNPAEVKNRFIRDKGQNPSLVKMDTYFMDNIETLKEFYWHNHVSKYNKKGYRGDINTSLNKGYHKMILTKYLTTSLDQIPKGSVGYFLGKRFTSVKVIKDTLEFYGLEWERKDAHKADFFIIGNDLKVDEVKLNLSLSRPMVMDDELRVDSYFSVYNKATIPQLENSRLTNLFAKSTYDNLKLICNLIQHVERGALTNVTKFRLLRLYVDIFSEGYDSKDSVRFDLGNKEHVFLSDTVQKFCIPHLRFYVTNSFLNNTSGKFKINQSKDRNGIYGEILTADLSYSYMPYNVLPKFEGSDEIYKADIEDNTSHSIAQIKDFKSVNDFAKYDVNKIWSNEDYSEFSISIENTFGSTNARVKAILHKATKELKVYNFEVGSGYSWSNERIITNLSSTIITDKESKETVVDKRIRMYKELRDFTKSIIEGMQISDVEIDKDDLGLQLKMHQSFKPLLLKTDEIFLEFYAGTLAEFEMAELKVEKRKLNLNYLNL